MLLFFVKLEEIEIGKFLEKLTESLLKNYKSHFFVINLSSWDGQIVVALKKEDCRLNSYLLYKASNNILHCYKKRNNQSRTYLVVHVVSSRITFGVTLLHNVIKYKKPKNSGV